MFYPIIISIHAPIVGCDIISSCDFVYISKFQSTHPSWGATKYNQKSAILEKISIHAPIVGCDVTSTGSQARFEKISIHAPIVGCDKGHATGYSLISLISIHAPIVGCDALKPKFPMVILYFNPRTHRGVRLYVDVRKTSQYDFNPRTHRGVRPKRGAQQHERQTISIHAPIVGCDQSKKFPYNQHILFQSTHPSWGATCAG